MFKIIERSCVSTISHSFVYPVVEQSEMCENLLRKLQIEKEDIMDEVGNVVEFLPCGKIPAKKIYFLHLPKNPTYQDLNKGLTKVFARAKDVVIAFHLFDQFTTEELAECVIASKLVNNYHFEKISSKKTEKKEYTTFLMSNDLSQDVVDRQVVIAKATNHARDLGNMPSNLLIPEDLANVATDLAKKHQLEYQVFSRKELEEMGAGGILGVGLASENEPKLIFVKYMGDPSSNEITALVGKGITFDTGGYSLKIQGNMRNMKFDMCGAANCFGAFKALVELKAKVNVYLVLCASENMISGKGLKVDDIITSLSGKTIEVTNTDAEGRLVLCDGITYAISQKATRIIDMATLTGACVVALGHEYTGVFSNNELFYRQFEAAAVNAREKIWRLPIGDEFTKAVRSSHYADLDNAPSRFGGSSIAASFLLEFVENDLPWIHLDIAGSGTIEANGLLDKGASGSMVKTLVELLG